MRVVRPLVLWGIGGLLYVLCELVFRGRSHWTMFKMCIRDRYNRFSHIFNFFLKFRIIRLVRSAKGKAHVETRFISI